MSVLFESIRTNARSIEYPMPSVVALESVLIRLYLESPVVGMGAPPGMPMHPMGLPHGQPPMPSPLPQTQNGHPAGQAIGGQMNGNSLVGAIRGTNGNGHDMEEDHADDDENGEEGE